MAESLLRPVGFHHNPVPQFHLTEKQIIKLRITNLDKKDVCISKKTVSNHTFIESNCGVISMTETILTKLLEAEDESNRFHTFLKKKKFSN